MADKKKILVIEDEQILRDLYVELLEDDGYGVDSAFNGEEGLEKIKKGGWDLVLLDIILPKMDGMTILRMLQSDPPVKPNGPIVLLTALAQDSLVYKALSLGAVGYLIKSEITPDQVLKEVEGFLEQS